MVMISAFLTIQSFYSIQFVKVPTFTLELGFSEIFRNLFQIQVSEAMKLLVLTRKWKIIYTYPAQENVFYSQSTTRFT